MGNSLARAKRKKNYRAPPEPKPWKAYCAIDIGSISSGYAYAFQDLKDIVWFNHNWAESLGATSYRVPSAILNYNSDSKEDKFGYEAIDEYITMKKKLRATVNFRYSGLLRFTEFNNAVITTKFDDIEEVEDHADDMSEHSGHNEAKQAVTNLTPGLSHLITEKADLACMLAKHCMNEIEKKYKRSPSEINWCLVVPYHYSISEKRKFRSTAKKKLLSLFRMPMHVTLVTSTESIWIVSRKKIKGKQKKRKRTKAIILINTGATRMETSLLTKESWYSIQDTKTQQVGSSMINHEFTQQLKWDLGKHEKKFMERCRTEYPAVWLRFMLNFEKAKEEARWLERKDLQMDVGIGFIQTFKKITEHSFVNSLSQKRKNNRISVTSTGKLLIPHELVTEMFNFVIDPLLTDVVGIFQEKSSVVKILGVLVTGGFGESVYLQERLKSLIYDLSHKVQIFTPKYAELIAVKGATTQAQYKKRSSRIYALSYYTEPTIKGSDYVEKISGLRIKKVFNRICPLICTDDVIKPGKVFKFGPFPMNVFKNKIYMTMYEVLESVHSTKARRFALHEFQFVNSFEYKKKIGQLSVRVPSHLQSTYRFNGKITLIMDATRFQVKMKVSSAVNEWETMRALKIFKYTTKVKVPN